MAESLNDLFDPSPAERTIGQVQGAGCTTAHMTTPDKTNESATSNLSRNEL